MNSAERRRRPESVWLNKFAPGILCNWIVDEEVERNWRGFDEEGFDDTSKMIRWMLLDNHRDCVILQPFCQA